MSQVPQKYKICDLAELNPGMSRGFDVQLSQNDPVLELFLVCDPDGAVNDIGNIHGYLNQCPHTRVNLNWLPDQFLNLEKSHIQCSMHGALFRIQDGVCVWGPCKGKRLQAVELVVEDASVFLKMT